MLDEVTERTEINDRTEEGWSRKPVWVTVDKEKGKQNQIKGCEIYSVADPEKKLMFSSVFADFGITGLHSITFVDYSRKKAVSIGGLKRQKKEASRFKTHATERNLTYYDSSITLSMLDREEIRRFLITAPSLELPQGEKGFKADVTIHHEEDEETMAALLKTNDGKGISCTTRFAPLSADGIIFIGDRIEKLSDRTLAAVSAIRNRGTARNEAMWIAAFGYAGTVKWSITFSPDSSLLNGVIVDKKLYKIGNCHFTYPRDLVSSAWEIADSDGMLSMHFEPFAAIKAREKIYPMHSESEEIFGTFSGRIKIRNLQLDITEGYGSVKKAAGKN